MTVTGDYVFVGLIILGGMLTLIALKTTFMLFRLAAALLWLTLGIMLITNSFSIGWAVMWVRVLGFVFIILAFAPLVMQIGTEVKREERGYTWTEWGRKPDFERTDPYYEYRQRLRGGMRRALGKSKKEKKSTWR